MILRRIQCNKYWLTLHRYRLLKSTHSKNIGTETSGWPLKERLRIRESGLIKPLTNTDRVISSLSFISLVLVRFYELALLSGIILCVFHLDVLSSYVLRQLASNPCVQAPGTLIVYGPPIDAAITDVDKTTLFYNTFRDVGRVIYSEYAGDHWKKDLEYFEDNKGDI